MPSSDDKPYMGKPDPRDDTPDAVPCQPEAEEHCPACDDDPAMCAMCAAWLSPGEWHMRTLRRDREFSEAKSLANPPAPRVTPEDIDKAIELSRSVQYHRFPRTTVVVCCVELDNGFCVVGKAAAVSAENFDMDIGMRVALDDVKNKMWELLGWQLKQAMFEGRVPA